MFHKPKNTSKRNRFTRMCIGEATVSLMQTKEYDKITVSDIAKKAGVSRMTYYHYYNSKLEALKDYLQEIISQYLTENRKYHAHELFREYNHVLFSLKFFDKYSLFFLTMTHAGMYSIMIDAVNEFMLMHLPEESYDYKYELFYYSGALLNIFIRWEEDGKQITAEELAKIICKCR